MRNNFFQSGVALLLLTIMTGSFLVPPIPAKAATGCAKILLNVPVPPVSSPLQVPTIDYSNYSQNSFQSNKLQSLETKEYCLDAAFKLLATQALQVLAQAVIEWVQSGGNDNFVSNLQAALGRAADDAAGEFLNALAGANLCSPFANDLRLAFRKPGIPRFGERMNCSATDIFNTLGTSYDNFLGDFTQGGWIAFETGLSGSNNYIDGLINAYDAKLQAESRAVAITKAQYDAGNGFLGVRVKKEDCSDPLLNNDEWISNPNDPVSQRNPCSTTYVQTTPGTLVSDQVKKVFGTGFDQLVAADELDEVINGLLTTLINQLITSAQEGLANNDSESGFNDPSISHYTPAEGDTVPPVVSNTNASPVAQTTATITWTTDEPATSKVYYQTSTPVSSNTASAVSDGTLTRNHSLTIAELATGTTYYYFVESKDANQNGATSFTQSFTTLP